MDAQGRVIIPPIYNGSNEFENGFADVRSGDNGLWGVVDGAGKIIIPHKYDRSLRFKDGLSVACVDRRTGLIDISGNIVIPIEYDNLQYFSVGGLVAIEQDGVWHLADLEGIPLNDERYDYILGSSGHPASGLIVIKRNGKYGLLLQNGQQILEPNYDSIELVKSGPIIVERDGKFALFDLTGTPLTDFVYTAIIRGSRHESGPALLPFIQDGRIGYLDASGSVAIQAEHKLPGSRRDTRIDMGLLEDARFHEGLAKFYRGRKVGYMDRNGNTQIAARFTLGRHFSDGLAAVKAGRKVFYINTDGEKIITVDASNGAEAPPFRDGVVKVTRIERDGTNLATLFTTEGVQLFEYTNFESFYSLEHGLAVYEENGAYGVKRIIDGQIEILIPPLFSTTWPLEDGLRGVVFGSKRYALNPQGEPIGFTFADVAVERTRWCGVQTSEHPWCADF